MKDYKEVIDYINQITEEANQKLHEQIEKLEEQEHVKATKH